MILNDALNILAIVGEYTPELIKKAYRQACSKYHPDRNPAGLEMMKLVNEAYATLKDESGSAQENSDNLASYGEEIFTALSQVIHLDFEFEICGSWVWLSGDTKPHKDIIKEAGFKWASKKKMWFYKPSDHVSKGRGSYSIDKIRETHGTQKINRKQRANLAA